MDNFITLDMFTNLAGCSFIATVLTEFTKKYIEKISPKYVALIWSTIIIVASTIATQSMSVSSVLLAIMNSILTAGASQGWFQYVGKPLESLNK